MPFSPEVTYGLTAAYFQDYDTATITYSASLHYRDEMEISPFPANAQGLDANGNFIIQQKANTQAEDRTLIDAFIMFEPNDSVALTLWGKNLTNEIYQFHPTRWYFWNFATFGEPRSLGVRASFNF